MFKSQELFSITENFTSIVLVVVIVGRLLFARKTIVSALFVHNNNCLQMYVWLFVHPVCICLWEELVHFWLPTNQPTIPASLNIQLCENSAIEPPTNKQTKSICTQLCLHKQGDWEREWAYSRQTTIKCCHNSPG